MPPADSTPRVTQRAPKRCTTCTKRKQRCDGTLPCAYCVSRSIESTCRRETVIVKGRLVEGADQSRSMTTSPVGSSVSPPTYSLPAEGSSLLVDNSIDELEQLRKENRSLRRKLAETKTRNEAPSPTLTDRSALPLYLSAEASSLGLTSPALPSNELGKAAARLGLLDASNEVGEYEVTDAVDAGDTASNVPPLNSIKPSQNLSTLLTDFALEELGWLPTFDFEQLAVARPAWTSLYLAILSCGLVYVRADRADQWGVPHEFKWSLARAWFDAALKIMFNGAACMHKPNLVFLQTFCVLTLVTQPFDCSALHDSLLASMMRHAYALKLHRLRENPSRSLATEIGRRIWAFLINREALYVTEGCAFAGQLSSETRPFETFLNINDDALVEGTEDRPPRPQPLGVPTKVSYLIAQTRLSAFISDFNRNQGTPTYDAVLIYDANLQHLLNDMPFFHPQASPQPGDPPWLPTARHVMALSIPQKRLLLHRHYFALSATDRSHVHSRQVSVDASLAILAERRVHDFPFDDKLDTLNHALPAAIVLLLDVLHPLPGTMYSPDKVRRRCMEVEELLSPLRGTAIKHSTLTLAKRVNMLDDLLRSTVEDLQKQTSPSQMFREIEAPPTTNTDGFSAMLDELGFNSLLVDAGNAWTLDPMQSFSAQTHPAQLVTDGASWMYDFS